MFGTIAITTAINWLIIAALCFWLRLQRSEREVNRLRKENAGMNNWIEDRENKDQEERVRQSYSQGLYDGRQTDTIYRKMLKQYQSGEQIAMILNGTETAEEHSCNGRDLG